jgi:predicted site-specific integrase-resolvase
MPDVRDLVTATEAARMLNSHRATIYTYVKAGKLTVAAHVAGVQLFHRDDIARLAPVKRGRPRKDGAA